MAPFRARSCTARLGRLREVAVELRSGRQGSERAVAVRNRRLVGGRHEVVRSGPRADHRSSRRAVAGYDGGSRRDVGCSREAAHDGRSSHLVVARRSRVRGSLESETGNAHGGAGCRFASGSYG